ncbi:putative ser/thr kinase [Paratrimastix pyriformis]|uniref:Ser/thr kinase n=1 Tax=Paratrimastix pyriformis TaxID=342808 RepID=A0ABQ8UDQ6_9EUKA|nr:putative ser/thr kinase [Paratrimastix pyriformis]
MLVTDDMRVKVSDFGISRLTQDQEGLRIAAGTPGLPTLTPSCPDVRCCLASHGSVLRDNNRLLSIRPRSRCPAWAAPEVLRGEQAWLPSDVFSFGVVLWELVTRQSPWDGVPADRVMRSVGLEGGRVPIPSDTVCPPVFRELMAACFAESPAARPTLQQVVARLSAESEHHPYVDAALVKRPAGPKTRKESGASKQKLGGERKKSVPLQPIVAPMRPNPLLTTTAGLSAPKL